MTEYVYFVKMVISIRGLKLAVYYSQRINSFGPELIPVFVAKAGKHSNDN